MVDGIMTYCHCQICDGRRRIHILAYEDAQYWQCEGGHVLVYDAGGKELQGVEGPDYQPGNWREKIDRQREVEYKPQKEAWNRQRRKGGRKKGGSGYNYYVGDAEHVRTARISYGRR